MHLFLVRHGQTDWNLKEIMQGTTDVALNETGKKQAQMVCNKLKNIKFDYCFSSPLKRAITTSKIICPIPPITDDRLIERGMGELEGKSRNFYNTKLYWDYELNSNLYGVEPIQSLLSRTEEFLNDLKGKYFDKTVLVVAHGATIRALNYVINGYNNKTNFLEIKIPNCCILEYNI